MNALKQSIKIIFLSLLTLSFSGIVYAWTEPASIPPGGNVSAPVNTSSNYQEKIGDFWANTIGADSGITVYNTVSDALLYLTTKGTVSGYPSVKNNAYTRYRNDDQSQGWLTGLINWDKAGNYSIMQSQDPWTRFFTIDSSGNVGIGTTSPSNKLTVSSATSLDGIFATNGTRWTKIMPGTVGAGSYNGIVQANDNALIYSNGTQGTGNFVIAPWASGTSGLRMDASGNVGIGTSPTFKFEVSGDGARSKFTNTNTANTSNVMVLQNNSTKGYSSIDFYKSDGSQMGFIGYGNPSASTYGDKIYLGSMNKNIIINPGTANVGIGTTAPAYKLDVNGDINYTGNLTKLAVADNFTATVGAADFYLGYSGRRGSPGRALVDLGSSLQLNYGNDWSNTVIGGNVGIGTTAPGGVLEIKDSATGARVYWTAVVGDYGADTDDSSYKGTYKCYDTGSHDGSCQDIMNSTYPDAAGTDGTSEDTLYSCSTTASGTYNDWYNCVSSSDTTYQGDSSLGYHCLRTVTCKKEYQMTPTYVNAGL